jgi:hypothetical protein
VVEKLWASVPPGREREVLPQHGLHDGAQAFAHSLTGSEQAAVLEKAQDHPQKVVGQALEGNHDVRVRRSHDSNNPD